jgi:hypothetical protein
MSPVSEFSTRLCTPTAALVEIRSHFSQSWLLVTLWTSRVQIPRFVRSTRRPMIYATRQCNIRQLSPICQTTTRQAQHKKSFSSSIFSHAHVSPNDFRCPCQHVGWNSYADLFRSLEIDHLLELRQLLHRQIGRLGAFQDLVPISGYSR